jgi:hypothetical protein
MVPASLFLFDPTGLARASAGAKAAPASKTHGSSQKVAPLDQMDHARFATKNLTTSELTGAAHSSAIQWPQPRTTSACTLIAYLLS